MLFDLWPDDDGLGEGGPEQKFQGGPSPYFFFLEKFYLLKIFFFGPGGGARAPLALYLGPSLSPPDLFLFSLLSAEFGSYR